MNSPSRTDWASSYDIDTRIKKKSVVKHVFIYVSGWSLDLSLCTWGENLEAWRLRVKSLFVHQCGVFFAEILTVNVAQEVVCVWWNPSDENLVWPLGSVMLNSLLNVWSSSAFCWDTLAFEHCQRDQKIWANDMQTWKLHTSSVVQTHSGV